MPADNKKKEFIVQPSSRIPFDGLTPSPSLSPGSQSKAGEGSAPATVAGPKPKPAAQASRPDSKAEASDEVPAKPLAAFQVRVGVGAVTVSLAVQPDMRGSARARLLALQVAQSCLEAFLGIDGCELSSQARSELQEYLGRAEYRVAYEVLVDLWNAGSRWPASGSVLATRMGRLWGVEFPQSTYPVD